LKYKINYYVIEQCCVINNHMLKCKSKLTLAFVIMAAHLLMRRNWSAGPPLNMSQGVSLGYLFTAYTGLAVGNTLLVNLLHKFNARRSGDFVGSAFSFEPRAPGSNPSKRVTFCILSHRTGIAMVTKRRPTYSVLTLRWSYLSLSESLCFAEQEIRVFRSERDCDILTMPSLTTHFRCFQWGDLLDTIQQLVRNLMHSEKFSTCERESKLFCTRV